MNTAHPKFKRMMTLFTQAGKQGYRHTYVWNASNGRTESSRELHEFEVDLIINKLEAEFKALDKADNMRKKLISMAREMGYEMPNPKNKKKNKADMERINNWCVKYGHFHKTLNKHTLQELPLLISQFEIYYTSFLSSL